MEESYIDLLHRATEYAHSLGVKYIDIRLEDRFSTNVSIRKKYSEEALTTHTVGAGVRVLYDGAWGFSSVEVISSESLISAVKDALGMARSISLSKKKASHIASSEAYREYVKADVKKNPLDVSLEEKVRMAIEVDKIVLEKEEIKDDRIRYSEGVYKKFFVNSEGTEIVIEGTQILLSIYVAAERGGVITPAYDRISKTAGFEAFDMKDPFELAREVSARAVRLLDATVPKGGLATAVLDHDLLGLIVHEAFGHTAEADLVMSGTVLTGKIGQQVASPLVTIIDSPGPSYAFGWVPYDDEGVKARDVIIVEKGILKEFMHTRETAAEMGASPTGNGRAQDYRHGPLVRMRNTYMAPGDWDPEEIIQETRDGFYLKGGLHGQADSNGEFMFAVQEAWKIENGKLVKPYRGVTVSGLAIDVLRSVDAVGKDLKIDSPGFCGKGQWVPVDGGGPHIRCKIIVGGGMR